MVGARGGEHISLHTKGHYSFCTSINDVFSKHVGNLITNHMCKLLCDMIVMASDVNERNTRNI